MPAMRLSEACLEASDVGALACGVHPRGGGFIGGGQVGLPKRRPALRGPQLRGAGGMCRVEECAEWVRRSLPPAEGGVEPAASDSEVGCYLLWCRVCPRFGASGLLLRGPGAVGLGGPGHGGGGIGRGGRGGPARSSRPRCGVGVGCEGAGMCCPWPRLWSMRGPYPPRWSRRASVSGPKKLGWLVGGARLGPQAVRGGGG